MPFRCVRTLKPAHERTMICGGSLQLRGFAWHQGCHRGTGCTDPDAPALRSRVEAQNADCSTNETYAERVFSVNGAVRPQVAIAPGEQQFWRIVNASADTYVDLELDGGTFDIVARDGLPLALHNPQRTMRRADHVLVPSAGRLEAIVKGRSDGAASVDVIMDFTDPVIRGLSVFHCHLLNHEDKGMMAKVLFQ